MRQVPMIVEPDPEDPGCAAWLVDGTVAGRPCRFLLDTGAARTQLATDEYTAALAPVAEDVSSGAFGGQAPDQLVTVTDLVVGPLHAATLDVVRVSRDGPAHGNLLGMDVLGRFACHFRLGASVLEVGAPPGTRADQELLIGSRGHPYVGVHWPGVTGQACWDTGAGITLVNRDFWLDHPELFEEIGTSTGTDSSGTQAQTPLLRMAGPVIGHRAFTGHNAVAVDLSGVNARIEHPMDLLLGYPTLRQADWLFDFPAKRWALTD
jgi:hypothetical protein